MRDRPAWSACNGGSAVRRAREPAAKDAAADGQFRLLANGSVRLNPMVHRVVTVSELDLMANIAGLRLSERFAGWDETAFGPESKAHVSVYEPVHT